MAAALGSVSVAWACATLAPSALVSASQSVGLARSLVTVTGSRMDLMGNERIRLVWLDPSGTYLQDLAASPSPAGDSFTSTVAIPNNRPGYYYISAFRGTSRSTPSVFSVTGDSIAAVVGGDSALYDQVIGNPYQGLSGGLIAAPAVVAIPAANGEPVPLFIALAGDHRLYVRSLDAPWQDLLPGTAMGCFDNPGAAVTGTNPYVLTVTCVGGDRALYYWEGPVTSSGLPAFPGPAPVHALGGGLLAGAAVAPVGGVLTFFAEGADHFIYTKTAGGQYTNIRATCNGHPAAAAAGADTFFACQGLDGALYYSRNAGGAGWGPYRSAGGQIIDGPGLALNPLGATVYVEGGNGQLYHSIVSLDGGSATGYVPDGGGIRFGAAAAGLALP
jgi:hypothetical protein